METRTVEAVPFDNLTTIARAAAEVASSAAQLLVMLSLNGAYGSAAPLSVAEQIEAKLERAYEIAKAVRKHIDKRAKKERAAKEKR